MADKPNKPKKIKARLPRGLADRGPAEIEATRIMVEAIRLVFERYGFEPVETPAIEYTDVLASSCLTRTGRTKVFSLSGRRRAMAVVGMISRHRSRVTWRKISRTWRCRTAAIVMVGYSATRNPDPGDIASSCSSMRILSALRPWPPTPRCACSRPTRWKRLDPARQLRRQGQQPQDFGRGDGCPGNSRRETPHHMRAVDKLDRLGIEGVRMLLGKGRKDESGDFTKEPS